jgi:hypothetical protein
LRRKDGCIERDIQSLATGRISWLGPLLGVLANTIIFGPWQAICLGMARPGEDARAYIFFAPTFASSIKRL